MCVVWANVALSSRCWDAKSRGNLGLTVLMRRYIISAELAGPATRFFFASAGPEREDGNIRPKTMTLKSCWDAVGGVGDALSSGDADLALELAKTLTACASDRTCDHYVICTEKAMDVVLRLMAETDAPPSTG